MRLFLFYQLLTKFVEKGRTLFNCFNFLLKKRKKVKVLKIMRLSQIYLCLFWINTVTNNFSKNYERFIKQLTILRPIRNIDTDKILMGEVLKKFQVLQMGFRQTCLCWFWINTVRNNFFEKTKNFNNTTSNRKYKYR